MYLHSVIVANLPHLYTCNVTFFCFLNLSAQPVCILFTSMRLLFYLYDGSIQTIYVDLITTNNNFMKKEELTIFPPTFVTSYLKYSTIFPHLYISITYLPALLLYISSFRPNPVPPTPKLFLVRLFASHLSRNSFLRVRSY